jgi:hypothetical protein
MQRRRQGWQMLPIAQRQQTPLASGQAQACGHNPDIFSTDYYATLMHQRSVHAYVELTMNS